jgi:hypothetical protein
LSTPLPFEFEYKPLCARATLSFPPISSSNLSLLPQTSIRVTNGPAGPSPWLHPSSSATRETAKQKACYKAMLAETTKQVNNLISEFFILPSSPSQEPEREPANIRLPTEHINKHSNVTTIHKQIEQLTTGTMNSSSKESKDKASEQIDW